jgi:ankyrin repeat protein
MAATQELSVEEKDELLKASNQGDLKRVQSIIKKGGPDLIKDDYSIQALLHAVEEEHENIVKFLVEKGVDLNDTGSSYIEYEEFHKTALMIAATKGNMGIVSYLIEKGAELDWAGYNEETPLHCAAESGHFEIVKFLVEKGANICHQDSYYKTPVSMAAASGHTNIVKYLLDKLPKKSKDREDIMWDAFYEAALYDRKETLDYLEEKGIDLNKHNIEREVTMLHEATKRKNHNVIRCLVERGANINVKDKFENTPLHIATENGDRETMTLLLNLGADINAQGEFKYAPIHTAIHIESLELVRFLVESKASLKIESHEGSPIEHAHKCMYLYAKPQVRPIFHYLLRFEKNLDQYKKKYPDLIEEVEERRRIKKAVARDELDENITL